jgi:hypothetical protein
VSAFEFRRRLVTLDYDLTSGGLDVRLSFLPSRSYWNDVSIHHPFDFIESHGVVAAVVEAGGAGGFVAGHLLSDFEFAAVLQVGGDAGGAEAMTTDPGCNAGCKRSALNHHVHVGLGKR